MALRRPGRLRALRVPAPGGVERAEPCSPPVCSYGQARWGEVRMYDPRNATHAAILSRRSSTSHHTGSSPATCSGSRRSSRPANQVGSGDGRQHHRAFGLFGPASRCCAPATPSSSCFNTNVARAKARRPKPSFPVCHHGITHLCIDVTAVDETEYQVPAWLRRAFTSTASPPGSGWSTDHRHIRDPNGNVVEIHGRSIEPGETRSHSAWSQAG